MQTRDYRLFDIQHAVLPTKLPLPTSTANFCIRSESLYMKHFNWRTAPGRARDFLGLLRRGQANFLRGMTLYPSIFNLAKMLGDHTRPVTYQMSPRGQPADKPKKLLVKTPGFYIHAPKGRAGRHIDTSTEKFVQSTR